MNKTIFRNVNNNLVGNNIKHKRKSSTNNIFK